MKISATYTESGKIQTAHEVLDSPRGGAILGHRAGPGERHAVFDAPAHHNGKKFRDVVHLLKVDVSGTTHRLTDK